MSLGSTAETLRAAGVEMIGVVGTAAARARRYFRYRRPRYPVAADPDLVSHRAFGVPRKGVTEEILRVIGVKLEGLAREAGLAAPPGDAWAALDREDGVRSDDFASDMERHQVQLTGQFLIDHRGVIRWSNIETERGGLEGMDVFPSDEELLAAVRAL